MIRSWYLPKNVQLINQADRIIVNSEAVKNYCISSGMRKEILQVIYPLIDLKRFIALGDQDRQEFRITWNASPKDIVIGLVGQVLPYKGHEDFIRAAAIVHQIAPDIKFVVVGDDSLTYEPDFLNKMKKLVEDLGLFKSFIFTGHVENIPKVMSSLDILAVPSWTEAFGRVAAEALAAKRPVIATTIGGLSEIIKDGVNGMLIPPHRPDALASAMIKLSDDLSLRNAFGEQGYLDVRKFGPDEHIGQMEKAYESVLGCRSEFHSV